uniref:Secreted protein n=1 Tax=Acrobeloides nanus TaxID=290746 RepID=A0A914CRU2_9BILA
MTLCLILVPLVGVDSIAFRPFVLINLAIEETVGAFVREQILLLIKSVRIWEAANSGRSCLSSRMCVSAMLMAFCERGLPPIWPGAMEPVSA